MRKTILYILIFNALCFFSSCKGTVEKRYFDSYGNEFVEKGNELSIIPAEYKKTGQVYKIFLYNETKNDIGLIDKIKIKPNEYTTVNLVDTSVLSLDSGVKFFFGETHGLQVDDKKNTVSGIGGEYLEKYNVPEDVEFAFVIVPEGEGDK